MIDTSGHPLYRLDLDVRWGDMDALGHVNNCLYFRYFEQTRVAWYASLGIAAGGAREMTVVVDNHAEYLRPLVHPARATVRMAGRDPGRSSFVSTYELEAGGELCTRGSAKIVWVDVASGRSTPLPERVRRLLGETPRA